MTRVSLVSAAAGMEVCDPLMVLDWRQSEADVPKKCMGADDGEGVRGNNGVERGAKGQGWREGGGGSWRYGAGNSGRSQAETRR